MIIRIKKESHFGFACLLTLLILMLFVRYSLGIEIPRIFLTLVIIAIAFIGTQDEVLAISLSCIPLHEAIDFYVALVACAGILIVKSNRAIKFGVSILLGISLVALELLHMLTFEVPLMSLLISIIPIAFLILILNLDVSKIDYAFIVRILAFISACFSLIVFLNIIVQANFDFAKAVLNLQRLGQSEEDTTLLGGRINPNALGIINVLSVAALFQLRSMNKSRRIDYFFSIILIIFGVLTSSKTFLVCLLLMAFLLIFAQKGGIYKKIRLVFLLIVSALLALLLLNLLFHSVLEYYISRFQVEDITTGRYQLIVQYNEYITNHPSIWFWGIGMSDIGNKAINVYKIADNVPHNSIQEIVLSWGIIGLLIIVLLFVIMVRESKQYGHKKRLLNFIPLIIILVKSMAGQLVTSKYTMLALVLAYLSLCQDFTYTEQLN